jgi:medium-chain acyl-[acyl-carrier-protein] hydrolase
MCCLGGNGNMKANGSSWFSRNSLQPSSRLRLFLLPPAGGSALIFRGWEDAMPPGVDVCTINLPGRGVRLHEPLFTRLEPMVSGLGKSLLPILDRPFAVFGHSMGALVAFELSRFLRSVCGLGPVVLFASGGRSPDVPEGRKDYVLPDAKFVEMIRHLKGTPEEILDNPEALQLLLPVLRADFEVSQTYEYREEPPLSARIKALGGTMDSTTGQEVLLPWRRHTTNSFSLSMLPGGHFFIEESRAQLLTIVAEELRYALHKLPPKLS